MPTGLLAISFATSANPFVQLGSEPQMRGRVISLYMLMFIGGTPLGAPFIGWLAETAGARWSLIGGGLLTLVCIAVGGWPCCGRAPADEADGPGGVRRWHAPPARRAPRTASRGRDRRHPGRRAGPRLTGSRGMRAMPRPA